MKINLSRILSMTLFVLLSSLILSCSKDKDNTPSGKSHQVQFKVVASAGSEIIASVFGIDNDVTTETSITGTEWASDVLTAPAGTKQLNLSVQAKGGDAAATLKAQIFVDGELKKEGTAKGEILVASANLEL